MGSNGGEYRGDLTKEVTHLVVHSPTGEKYRYAKLWDIQTVTIEWLEQSLERGMVLNEMLYDPLMDAAERGRGAWVRATTSTLISTSTLGKRQREKDSGGPVRKLRRSASAKFQGQEDNIWMDIVSRKAKPQGVSGSTWDEQGGEGQVSTRASSKLDSQAQQSPLLPSIPQDFPAVKKPTRKGLFHGRRFYLHGFDPKKVSLSFFW